MGKLLPLNSPIDMFLPFILYILLISLGLWYAGTAGRMWHEAVSAGGWIKIVMYAALAMSAVILTWCYMILIFKLLQAADIISPAVTEAATGLIQLMTVPLVALTSLLLYLDLFSVWKRRGLASGAIDEKMGSRHLDNALAYGNKSLTVMERMDALLELKEKNLQMAAISIALFSLLLGLYTTVKVFARYRAISAETAAR